MGKQKASLDDVMKEPTHFIGACYGQKCDPPDTMSSVRYNVCRALGESLKGVQYPSETKVTAAPSDTLQVHAAVRGHAPGKYVVVQLRSWLVHCSASMKAAQHAAIPRLFH